MKFNFITSNHLVPYEESIDEMRDIVERIIAGNEDNRIWLLEHQPIYTVGASVNSTVENIAVQIDGNMQTVPIISTDRGGKITFHGPGQRVVYLMLDLRKLYNTNHPDLKVFLNDIHAWIINVLKILGIQAFQDEYPGIWVNRDNKKYKIAAIGMKIRKWVSFHGIALNINTDMRYFDAITPCGITDPTRGVTSIQEIMQRKIEIPDADDLLKRELIKKFSL